MAGIPGAKISDLTSKSASMSDADEFIIANGGNNYKIDGSEIRAGIAEQVTQTIDAAGAIIVGSTAPFVEITLDTFGGGAADDLDTITTSATGFQQIIIQSTVNARVPTIRDSAAGGGNVNTAGSANFALTTKRDKIVLQYRAAQWDEIARSTN
jgi:hypothetical protein